MARGFRGGRAARRLLINAIARKVGLDRKTVHKHLECGLEAPAYGPRAARPQLLDAYEDYLRERITRFPDLSGRRPQQEIKELGYAGG